MVIKRKPIIIPLEIKFLQNMNITKTNKSKDRIEKVLDYLKISANKFSKEIGHNNNVKIQHIKSGRNEFSPDVASQIENRYPEFNFLWLLKGQGEMLKNGISMNGNNEGNIQQMNLENIDMGNDNNITINNGNKEKEGEVQEKYDDSNDNIICILKKQLQEKDEQIKLLLDIIKNK